MVGDDVGDDVFKELFIAILYQISKKMKINYFFNDNKINQSLLCDTNKISEEI